MKRKKHNKGRRRSETQWSAWGTVGTFALGAMATGMGLVAAGRFLAEELVHRATRIVMTDIYDENLWELVSAASRVGVQNIVETNMRAERGTVIQRPLGSPRRLPDFKGLMFDAVQLRDMPTPHNREVDMRVTIGPKATKPLQIDVPIIVAAMAYGWALSEKAKVGLALGAAAAGTASNVGQGPFLESERQAAKKLIMQYHRGKWSKNADIYRRSDMIEIQIGQGAAAGIGIILEPELIDDNLRRQFGLRPGEPAVSHARLPGVHRVEDLGPLVKQLREASEGVPIGFKMAPGKHLERELEIALEADIDFLSIDGAQAASKGAPPILQDDFGLPTLFALVRAHRFLERAEAKDKVSLIISGGLSNPGDYLKAIALGADAVSIGAMALFAMSHLQVMNAVPYEPPTQAVWYGGKGSERFDPVKGGESLYKYLLSCKDEMAEGIRALGKTSLKDLSREDLFALDKETAEICGVPLGYHPQKIPDVERKRNH